MFWPIITIFALFTIKIISIYLDIHTDHLYKFTSPLYDIIHVNSPQLPIHYKVIPDYIIFINFSIGWLIIGDELLQKFLILHLLRLSCIICTRYPSCNFHIIPPNYLINLKNIFDHNSIKHDLMFSGHAFTLLLPLFLLKLDITIITIILYLYLFTSSIIGLILVIITRQHYTNDVIIGAALAYLIA